MGNTVVNGDLVCDNVTDLSVGGTKLKRVDTGAWETVRKCSGLVTAAANSSVDPGTKTTITSAGHEQTTGTTVTIAGTTDYNGVHVISNVTTDTFDIEVVYTSSQTGTFWADNEYKAPEAFQHGGAFGEIKRRYFKGHPSGTNTTLEAGFHATKQMVGSGGYAVALATGSTLTIPCYFGGVSNAGLNDNGTDLIYIAGSGFDDGADTYAVHVDYVLR
jgi:hypothetical protein